MNSIYDDVLKHKKTLVNTKVFWSALLQLVSKHLFYSIYKPSLTASKDAGAQVL